MLLSGFKGDAAGLFDGEAENAGGDGRKGDGLDLMLTGEFQLGAVGRGQEGGIAGQIAVMTRADGVDDPRGF